MYANGFCPTAADGTPLPCPDGYGALIGTAAVCALLEVLISFIPPSIMLRIFPPIVTGPTASLIEVSLIQSASQCCAGGSGLCAGANPTAFFAQCPNITALHALPWGSAEHIGQWFLFFGLTFCRCD